MHAIGIHQLQVVYHDDFHLVFPHQSTSLGTQLEHREAWRIVYVDWRVFQSAYILVQSRPFQLVQLSIEYLVAWYLADIGYQTIDQLHVAHLQGKETNGHIVVHCYVLGQAQRERSLSHGGSSCYDDQVGRLPSARHLVQSRIARGHTCKTCCVAGRSLQYLRGLFHHRLYLGEVLLHVLLRKLKELAFGMLHQFVYVHSLVEGPRLHVTGIVYQLPCRIFLGQDTGMILNMSRRAHGLGYFQDISRAPRAFQRAFLLQFLDYCHDVHGPFVHVHGLYGLIYLLVARLIECFGTQYFRHHGESLLVYQQSSYDQPFQLQGLRLNVSVCVIYRRGLPGLAVIFCLSH